MCLQEDQTTAYFLQNLHALFFYQEGSGLMKRVLIVDDSEKIRERLVTLLSEEGQIQVVGQVGSGRDTMNAMRRLRPDTVILDIRLPDISGIELLKEIKARYPALMVIMLTNFDNVQYRRQCRQLGADHFLNKTLEFEKIIDTILGSPIMDASGTGQRNERS